MAKHAEKTVPFEVKLLERVREDYASAKQFSKGFHDECNEMYAHYHNARHFVSLRKVNRFPMPIIQEDSDVFVADINDKLWFADRPCTLRPAEEADADDAKLKQEMLNYQDKVDDVKTKTSQSLQDATLCRIGIAQVDYSEKKRRRWTVQENVVTGSVFNEETGEMQEIVEDIWQLKDFPTYMGATVRHVDPRDFFIQEEKQEIDDEFPVMIRSWRGRDFFNSQPYFFNQHKLDENRPDTDTPGGTRSNSDKGMFGDRESRKADTKDFQMIEWQGPVDKKELFKYMKRKRRKVRDEEVTDQMIAEVMPREKEWAIIGYVVEIDNFVRLEANPFDIKRPNTIVGVIQSENEGLLGRSLAQKLVAVQRGSNQLMGMILENLKQSVNAWSVINVNALVDDDGASITNKAGGVLKTNQNPKDVFHRVEQPRVATELFALMEMLKATGQSADGMRDILKGAGQADTETLGESVRVLAQASLRMREYLRSWERTFIEPLWELRNEINENMIDAEYAFAVLGLDGIEWKRIKPEQLRSGVEFICESSVRETNKNVLIQQLLQMSQIMPLIIQAGQPVRIDKLAAELAESGFNWDQKKINKIFPLIGYEDENPEQENELNKMMAENALLRSQLERIMMVMTLGQGVAGGGSQNGNGNGAGKGPGQEIAQPTNEGDAAQSIDARTFANFQGVGT